MWDLTFSGHIYLILLQILVPFVYPKLKKIRHAKILISSNL